MLQIKKAIICKDEDSNKYEVWKRLENKVLDWEFIDTFDDMHKAIKYCEDNEYEICTSYGEKEYK
jgi:hypothetical protein